MSRSEWKRGKPDSLVKYSGMIWLLISQLAVMLPFMSYLPVWLMLVLLACAAWRMRVIRGHWAQPSWLLKGAVIALGALALHKSGLSALSLDTAASLLLFGFAFKSLEVIHRRDAVVVVFTGYFLVAVQFLYEQSIGAAAYGFGCLVLLTAALIAAQESPGKKTGDHLRLSLTMLLQCLPLMIVVYLFFPRIPPLWAVHLPSDQAVTGISDRMAPGEIARLSQSDAVAFRVSFAGARPPQNQLYWRGLTLNHFDGSAWSQSRTSYTNEGLIKLLRKEPPVSDARRELLDYEVVYETTHQPWLFTLTRVVDWKGQAILGSDERLMARQPLRAPEAFSVSSDLQAVRDEAPDPALRMRLLDIPPRENPKARTLARSWRQQARSDRVYAQKVLRHFQTEAFYYTLRPPLSTELDTIDDFLFSSRRGFCSHYAGSFVYLMRAAGIPARVVVGYQGGEWNTGGRFLTVRQYDAHAWTEAWLEGEGWVRFDPTAMVSPQRVEQDLRTAVQAEGSFLEGRVFSLARIQWLNALRQQWDAVEYGWRRWVLGYDAGMQTRWLQDWLGELSAKRVGLAFAGLFALILLAWLFALGYLRRGEPVPPALQVYRRLCRKYEKRGLQRLPNHTPGQFSICVAERFPERAGTIQEFTRIYEQLSYGRPSSQQAQLLLQRLKHLARQL